MSQRYRHSYNPNIQALRGISILLVLSFHFFNYPRQSGAIGVGLFFCISGYLITSILMDEFEENGKIRFKTFYIRRARRLLPLAYSVLLLSVLLFTLLRVFHHANINEKQLILSAVFCFFYIGNLFGLTHMGFNDLATPISHFWTLAVEEQFYVVWPILLLTIVRRLKKSTPFFVVFGLIALSILLHTLFSLAGKTVWTLPTTYLDILLAGCLLSMIQFKYGFRLKVRDS